MTGSEPTHLYVGPREAVIAEASAQPFYKGKYLAQLIGDGQYDAIGVDTKKDLKAIVADLRFAYPGIQVVWL